MRLVALVSFVLLWSGSTTLAQSPIATVEPPPLHLDAAVAWARLHHPALASGAAARIKSVTRWCLPQWSMS